MPILGSRGSGSAIGFGLTGLAKAAFVSGNKTVASLNTLASSMANGVTTAVAPTSGGTLTVNGVSLGSYDYTLKLGSQTVSSFTSSDWFTATEDSRSAFIAVDGNLTINSGQTFTPSTRKLFTCIAVNGNLTVNGAISMTGKGANHSSSGSNTSAGNIQIITGTYSSITNPSIPSAGGGAGLGGVDPNGAWGGAGKGATGGSGTAGGTGGGGGGSHYLPWYVGTDNGRGGDGAAGTSFSGGSAGGSKICMSDGTENASPNGGAGGNSANYFAGAPGQAGAAGNPTGLSRYGSSFTVGTSPVTGTGGVLIIFVSGTYSGTGTVSANGTVHGAGSGGGSVTIITATDSGPTPTATGGISGEGDGGAGTARKLTGFGGFA
jgi:hypothetical protein